VGSGSGSGTGLSEFGNCGFKTRPSRLGGDGITLSKNASFLSSKSAGGSDYGTHSNPSLSFDLETLIAVLHPPHVSWSGLVAELWLGLGLVSFPGRLVERVAAAVVVVVLQDGAGSSNSD
jgi:hypothetical protein